MVSCLFVVGFGVGGVGVDCLASGFGVLAKVLCLWVTLAISVLRELIVRFWWIGCGVFFWCG